MPKNSKSELVHRCLEKLAEGKFSEQETHSTVNHLREYLLYTKEIDKREHEKPSTWAKITVKLGLLWTAAWIPAMYFVLPPLLASSAFLPFMLGAGLLALTVVGTLVATVAIPMAVYKLFSVRSAQKKEQQQLTTHEQCLENELEKLIEPINRSTTSHDVSVTAPNASSASLGEATDWKKSASSDEYTPSSFHFWQSALAGNDTHTR